MDAKQRAHTLDRALRLFTEVCAGEGINALLLSLNIFLILTALYILKPVREALILGEGSALLVFVGTTAFAVGASGFAKRVLCLVCVWVVLAVMIGREVKRLFKTGQPPS